MLPIQGAQVWSLVRELWSHMPRGAAYSQKKKKLFRHFHSKIKLQKQLHLLLFLIYFPSPLTQIRPSNPPLNTHTLMHARTHTHTHTLIGLFPDPISSIFQFYLFIHRIWTRPSKQLGAPTPRDKARTISQSTGWRGRARRDGHRPAK